MRCVRIANTPISVAIIALITNWIAVCIDMLMFDNITSTTTIVSILAIVDMIMSIIAIIPELTYRSIAYFLIKSIMLYINIEFGCLRKCFYEQRYKILLKNTTFLTKKTAHRSSFDASLISLSILILNKNALNTDALE